ncbi:MAG: hypothetical protein KJO21_01270 [Verrucomicrobiae bacterium]|nr:hypothetical protein [Verrucomicrobiae bacterium]NNJ42164.1 hypothetical protein [Akkermansiaceae bacterium]
MNRRRRGSFTFLGAMTMMLLLAVAHSADVAAETKLPGATSPESASGLDAAKPQPESGLKAALKKLKLPGVKINLEGRCVDVDGSICLDQGALELIACTKNTKEHESIVALDAKAKHIHTALLLIGAKPGNPAMQKAVDKEKTRWIHVPPRGGEIDVFIVYKNMEGKVVEHPISKFIEAYEEEDYGAGEETSGEDDSGEEKNTQFPTQTLLFAGSFLHGEGDGPRQYLADQSGNVISLATFGDELLCLPGVYGHSAGDWAWQIDSTHLPAVGTKVKLRLRPKISPAPDAGSKPSK